ncbi:MAG TPA: FAD-binding oxidoreductase [Frankiaceae bacterium]|nr:FAD-binding oxidoreductase [Frankiaceae bacterium]
MTVPWSGWGDPARRPGLPPRARAFLRRELGLPAGAPPRLPVPAGSVALPPSALPAPVRDRLARIVGADHVREDRGARLAHAGGQSYGDLVRRRAGDAAGAPDAVVLPGDAAQVGAVLRVCGEAGVAVVPYGGGTSVVGGVAARRGRFGAVVSMDLRRLDRLLAVDEESLTATVQPGLSGPRLAELLAVRGLTLGHLPQSFERSTVGGWVATRSAGQASTGYGRVDALVVALRAQTPVGELVLGRGPASAAGPDLRALLVGGEGAFGVVTEVTLRVRRRPVAGAYEGWSFPGFGGGLTAFRRLAQEGVAADVCRLSDAEETRVTLAQAGRVATAYLTLRGHRGGCLAILGWEGGTAAVRRRRRDARRVLRAHGGRRLGRAVGRGWERGRFSAPYLRDDLLDAGVLVETLETAASWSRLPALHAAVRDALAGALRRSGGSPLVLCHVSHLYPTGASLYCTVLDRAEPGAELARWDAAKRAATDTIMAGGGTLTHHHGVGADHLRWLPAEVGELGVELLRTVKRRLDPAGVLNPGVLVPEEER